VKFDKIKNNRVEAGHKPGIPKENKKIIVLNINIININTNNGIVLLFQIIIVLSLRFLNNKLLVLKGSKW